MSKGHVQFGPARTDVPIHAPWPGADTTEYCHVFHKRYVPLSSLSRMLNIDKDALMRTWGHTTLKTLGGCGQWRDFVPISKLAHLMLNFSPLSMTDGEVEEAVSQLSAKGSSPPRKMYPAPKKVPAIFEDEDEEEEASSSDDDDDDDDNEEEERTPRRRRSKFASRTVIPPKREPTWATEFKAEMRTLVGSQAVQVYMTTPEYERECQLAVAASVDDVRAGLERRLEPQVREQLERTLAPAIDQELRDKYSAAAEERYKQSAGNAIVIAKMNETLKKRRLGDSFLDTVVARDHVRPITKN